MDEMTCRNMVATDKRLARSADRSPEEQYDGRCQVNSGRRHDWRSGA